MPRFGPIKRKDLIHCLRRLGFSGPQTGGKHEYMSREKFTLAIPNQHHSDIGPVLLGRILKEAGISRSEWEAV